MDDLINDLATAARKRFVEHVAFAGYLMALESNNLERTQERITPYMDALNDANKKLWAIVWDGYKAGLTKKYPGKAPVVKFNSSMKCDGRCQNATGYDCECSCAGANHGINSRFFAGIR